MNPRLTAPLSLAAAAFAVVLMAVLGFNKITAPFDTNSSSASTGPTACAGTKTSAKFLSRGQVTVSVYNAGKRSGRAGAAMDLLEAAGFKAGAVGNAPAGTKVAKVRVMSTQATHPEATLVARAFGKSVPVLVVDDDLGPGVDVIIGDKFNKLVPNAIERIKVAGATNGC